MADPAQTVSFDNPPQSVSFDAGPSAVQPSISEQPSALERTAQGFGAAGAETLTGLGKIGSKIPGVSYLAEKAGDVMGLPKLPEGTDPYKTVQEGIKPAEEEATKTLAGKIGYGGENLTEFLLGDAALKGLSLAEKLANASKVAKIFEASPRLMKALQAGADLSKLESFLNPSDLEYLGKSPVLQRLVTAGMDALRQGTVQAAQTTAKTGGDLKEGAKAGVEMAGVSGVLGVGGAAISGTLEKGAKAAKTVETLTKVAKEAPTEPEVTGAAQSAVEAAKKQMHSAYDTGIKNIAGRLEGETAQLEGSPLQSKAKELLKTTAEHPEGLTKELRESLQGVVPGTERGTKMLKTLAASTKEGEAKTPLTIDNLIKYRENLGKVARDLPHDDPNIKTVYGLLDGVDDTIEKMAKESGDKTLSSGYDALRQAYKEKVKFFQPSNKPADQLAYNTVKVLRSGTKDDIGKYLLSGGNIRAKVGSVKELLGPEATQSLGKDIFSTMVKESSKTEGRVNPANLIKSWSKIPDEVKSDLFDTKVADTAIQELAKDTKSAAQIQHLARLGLVGGIGATGVGSIGHLWIGTLLGLTIGEAAHGGIETARNMLDYITTHPAVWKSLGVASKVAKAAQPVTKTISPVVKQQATQSVMGKPSLASVYNGAAQPLGNQ